ncbi:hypothetical protein GIB67_018442 [Kingdonia uniflora]|uniref:Myb/SANT-like domain-containing protein n=1 Tax=Kingdonia uniflora TaxID=39325 RepID=A0A7J7LJ83_9MAGN|nr:hypothetical protein GIB67_018442 [Kingdonia uniflora]
MLHTFLALCKRELEITKDVRSGLSKDSWTKIWEEYNAKFHLTHGPKYFSNVWSYQRVKYNAWTWLLRRTESGFNAETRTFHLPPEEWNALIKINMNISTFRKDGLPYEDLLEAIFANRVTIDVASNFNIGDENDVPTYLVEEDTDTYFTNHHFEPSGGSFHSWSKAEPSIPQPKQFKPYHLTQSAPQLMPFASQSESSHRSGKKKRKAKNTLDKLDELIEVIKTQGEREELVKQDMRGKKLSEVLVILKEMELLGYLMNTEMTKACLKFTEHLEYADMFVSLDTLESRKNYLM